MSKALFLDGFLEYLAVARNVSKYTLRNYERAVAGFLEVHPQPTGLSSVQIEGYLQRLSQEGLSARSQALHLSAIKHFYKFLVQQGAMEHNPAMEVQTPKLPQTLPKALTASQVKALLRMCEGETTGDLRARAMLYVLYGCGLRVSEMLSLRLSDVVKTEDEVPVLRVTGKGQKTRLVPLGPQTQAVIEDYLTKGRLVEMGNDFVFPSRSRGGKRAALTRQRAFQILQTLGKQAGVKVAPHHLRHTFATHLLENDADLRAVQSMLGHASLTTTQIYTKVTGKRLKETLEAAHPLGSQRNK